MKTKLYIFTQELSYNNKVGIIQLILSRQDELFKAKEYEYFEDYINDCVGAITCTINGNCIVMQEDEFKKFQGRKCFKKTIITTDDIQKSKAEYYI